VSRAIVVNSTVRVPEGALHVRAVRASGPGGQNVNKVSSKVELRFDLAATRALDEATKARLRAAAPSRLDAEGKLRSFAAGERGLDLLKATLDRVMTAFQNSREAVVQTS